jgi:two-component system CheB/CheR fusion protein
MGRPTKTGARSATAFEKAESPAPDARNRRSKAPGGSPSTEEFTVVGIGASAGGLEALRSFLAGLPNNLGVAYVIAQHLDPKHSSALVELLARGTSMRVCEIEDGQSVQRNEIYITPPDRNAIFSHGVLRLSRPTTSWGPKPSVDMLFISLAEACKEQAVGIVLSGTGSDGAHGVRSVRASGGITVAQDPATAKYDGMPSAAIATNCVDLVLPPEKIGAELRHLLERPPTLPPTPKEEVRGNLERVFARLLELTGCDFSGYKPATISRRIQRRMVTKKVADLDDYIAILEQSPDEVKLLFRDVLISVTEFFRDPDVFKDLRRTFGQVILHKKKGDDIRIWVPGCASGEEAYTVAILLADTLGDRIIDLNVQIFATDIDEEALLLGRAARYPPAAVASLPKDLVDRYFVHSDGGFAVAKRIRELVVFAKHDLVKDPPFAHLDFISCRNVLIYFNSKLQDRVLSMFHYALEPGGYLLLGKSESVGSYADLFEAVGKTTTRIFRRTGLPDAGKRDFVGFQPLPLGRGREASATRVGHEKVGYAELMNNAILDVLRCVAVIVNNRQEVAYVRGNVRPYLGIRLANGEGNTRTITFRVQPIGNEFEKELVAVFFEETIEESTIADLSSTAEGPDPRNAELERELNETKESLQTTIEELETANEELQALNEEMVSANEELQSSNEELQSTNEELQSTNEELVTVNEEVQVKSTELSNAKSDLENIQASIGFPIVVVDRQFRVKRITKKTNEVFALRETDVGQTIMSAPLHLEMSGLEKDLQNVIARKQHLERMVKDDQRVFWLRIFPYFHENEVLGAVLTFIDITERKRNEDALRQLSSAVENCPSAIVITNAQGTIEYANPAFEKSSGYTAEEAIGNNPRILKSGRVDNNVYADLWGTISSGRVWKGELCNKRKSGELYWDIVSIAPLANEEGKITHYVGVQHDVSELRLLEQQLQHARKMEALGQLTGGIAHDFNNLLAIILGNLQLLSERVSDNKTKELIDDAVTASERGSSLIHRLLAFSRRQPLAPQGTDLNEVMARMTDLLRRTLGEFVEVREVPRRGLWPTMIDRNELEHALINLAINARDAMPDGGVLTIETDNATVGDDGCHDPELAPGDYVSLAVSDTGSGMRQEVVERIFEPFFTTKETGKGTGLGLSQVYGFVTQSGGNIAVTSEVGRGTRVCLYFPRASAGEVVAVDRQAADECGPSRGEVILVVEDEPGVRKLATEILRIQGYTVVEAVDAAAALKVLEHVGSLDLLFTDIILPGGSNGADLAGKVKERRPEAKVLYTTGYAKDAVLQQVPLDERSHLISKPYRKEDLLRMVRSALDGAASGTQEPE